MLQYRFKTYNELVRQYGKDNWQKAGKESVDYTWIGEMNVLFGKPLSISDSKILDYTTGLSYTFQYCNTEVGIGVSKWMVKEITTNKKLENDF